MAALPTDYPALHRPTLPGSRRAPRRAVAFASWKADREAVAAEQRCVTYEQQPQPAIDGTGTPVGAAGAAGGESRGAHSTGFELMCRLQRPSVSVSAIDRVGSAQTSAQTRAATTVYTAQPSPHRHLASKFSHRNPHEILVFHLSLRDTSSQLVTMVDRMMLSVPRKALPRTPNC